MSTLRISNIEAKSVPASATIDEKVKITNSSGDTLVFLDGKTSGITTVGINTTDGNITFDANSNVVVTGIITATRFSGQITPTSLEIGSNIKLGNAGVITATSFVGNLTGNATSADTVDTTSSNNNSTHYLTFVDSSGSQSGETLRTYTNLTVNPNSGALSATSFNGDGSSLTGIEVGISTASAQVSGITTVVDLSKDDIRLDCTGLVTIDTKGGTEGGNHILRIVNSGIATVSFNSYFKFPSGGTPALPTASGAISLISFTVHTQGRVGVASVFLAGSSVNFS